MKPILIASDHAGFDLKEGIKKELEVLAVPHLDLGTNCGTGPVDYPEIGVRVAEKIESGEYERGIIVCGTGIGISIAANRYRHVRAALCTTAEMASLARRHNDANVLALGGRMTSLEAAREIVNAFLRTDFEGGRHKRRVDMLSQTKVENDLRTTDPEIYESIRQEEARQNDTLEMIASENFTSRAVMQAMGSVMTNKYAEGYPRKRYYGGCVYVDRAEELAIERAKKLFNAQYANVQPHSGSQANMAVYYALLNPGDTVMGLDLAHGGHLTHGSKVNFSGRFFNVVSYKVNEKTQVLDYDELRALAREHKPKMIIAGGSAYPRTLDFGKFREICNEVGARLMVDMAHIAGLIAAGLHPSPMAHAHAVTTTTHKTLRGPRGGMILANEEEMGKAFNKNIFPGIQGGPLMHVIAAKAVAFKEALEPSFRSYQKQVIKNAQALAEGLLSEGFNLVSGGTDTHLMLVDLRSKNITGKDAEHALELAGITVNKNTIPFDPQKPMVTSGIRIGTPALTTRGMREEEMRKIANLIGEALSHAGDENEAARIRGQVGELCKQFPLYRV